MRCGCKKRQKICGPGCLCQGCKNIETSEISNSDSKIEDSDGKSSCSESGGEDFRCDTIEEEIITDDLFMNTYDIIIKYIYDNHYGIYPLYYRYRKIKYKFVSQR